MQTSGCSVENYLICEGDPVGSVNGLVFTQAGIDQIFRTTKDGYSDKIDYIPNRYRSWLDVTGSTDIWTMSELLETGHVDWDMRYLYDVGKGMSEIGSMSLTDQTIVIDGHDLIVADYTSQTVDTGGVFFDETDAPYSSDAQGTVLISKQLGMYFFGKMAWSPSPTIQDYTPVEFNYPNDIGFSVQTPIFNCEGS